MATINKKRMIQKATGLPSKEEILTAPKNTDTVPAMIQSPDGQPQGPAKLTEGEFVFSLPAIIALGEGDYDQGLSILEELHTELHDKGVEMLSEQGLGSAYQD